METFTVTYDQANQPIVQPVDAARKPRKCIHAATVIPMRNIAIVVNHDERDTTHDAVLSATCDRKLTPLIAGNRFIQHVLAHLITEEDRSYRRRKLRDQYATMRRAEKRKARELSQASSSCAA